MWPYTLSGRLPVDALVGHYPTNKLIGRGLILHRKNLSTTPTNDAVISGIRPSFPGLSRSAGQITHVLLTRSPLIHGASTASSFDLHVLSTPPAFVLSQDQTLHKSLLSNTKSPKPDKTNNQQHHPTQRPGDVKNDCPKKQKADETSAIVTRVIRRGKTNTPHKHPSQPPQSTTTTNTHTQ